MRQQRETVTEPRSSGTDVPRLSQTDLLGKEEFYARPIGVLTGDGFGKEQMAGLSLWQAENNINLLISLFILLGHFPVWLIQIKRLSVFVKSVSCICRRLVSVRPFKAMIC